MLEDRQVGEARDAIGIQIAVTRRAARGPVERKGEEILSTGQLLDFTAATPPGPASSLKSHRSSFKDHQFPNISQMEFKRKFNMEKSPLPPASSNYSSMQLCSTNQRQVCISPWSIILQGSALKDLHP
ncbi:hypothetical protein ATANTOWER_017367 [Ataeniobius toweri]|uniref:Uncharacterized protein n=1 Tax=Ataeniobius toweri TaxID=208326 RepID=A0ABU7BTB9_9TELE|nr:hypothetical protein [Ataeniobius toweri]